MAALAASALLVTVAACSSDPEPGATGDTADPGEPAEQIAQTLVIAQEIPPVLDPAFMESDRQRTLITNLFEPLVRMDSSGEVVPALAESWSSEDDTTWTFTLRSDAAFSDGTPITAQDVVYSLVRTLTPVSAEVQQALGVDSSSPKGLAVLPDVVGVAEINAGTADTLPAESITAPDDATVVIQLTAPSADLLARLAYPALGVVKQDNIENPAAGGPWWYAPVASGPFQLDDMSVDSFARLTPNESYFGTVSQLEAVEFRVIEDTQTAIVAWESGDMDIVKVLTSEVKNLESAGHNLMSAQEAQTVVLLANPIGATADMHVLRALAMAMDKETLASALDGLVVPAFTFTSPISPGYDVDGVPLLEFDPAAAVAELELSGMSPDEISININNPGNLDSRAVPVIAQMWEQNLGITVNILNELPPATAPEGQAANLLLLAQGPNYTGTCAMAHRWPDFLTFAAGANNVNFGAIEGPGLEDVVEQCATAPDDAAAWEAVREFETLLTEYPQFIPTWYGNSYFLVNEDVQNIEFGNNWHIANLPEVTMTASE